MPQDLLKGPNKGRGSMSNLDKRLALLKFIDEIQSKESVAQVVKALLRIRLPVKIERELLVAMKTAITASLVRCDEDDLVAFAQGNFGIDVLPDVILCEVLKWIGCVYELWAMRRVAKRFDGIRHLRCQKQERNTF